MIQTGKTSYPKLLTEFLSLFRELNAVPQPHVGFYWNNAGGQRREGQSVNVMVN